MAFSDFPWPKTAPEFPQAREVRRYLERYAEENGLQPYVPGMNLEVCTETLPETTTSQCGHKQYFLADMAKSGLRVI